MLSPLGNTDKDSPLLLASQQPPAPNLVNQTETAEADIIIVKPAAANARRQIRLTHDHCPTRCPVGAMIRSWRNDGN